MVDKKTLPLWRRRAGVQVWHDLPGLLSGVVVGGVVVGGVGALLADRWQDRSAFTVWGVAFLVGLAVGVIVASIRAPYLQRNAARAAYTGLEAELSSLADELATARRVSISSRVVSRREGGPRSSPLMDPVTAASRVQVWFHNASEFTILGVEIHMDPSPYAEPQHWALFSEAGPDRKDDKTFDVPAFLPPDFTPRTWVEFDAGSGRRWRKVENQRPEPLEEHGTGNS